MKKHMKKAAAILVSLMLLQSLFSLSLTAQHEGSVPVVAVLSGGFAGSEDTRFAGVMDGRLTKKSVRNMLPSPEGKGAYINARIPFAYDYAGKDTDLDGKTDIGMTLCDIIASEAPAVQLLLMKIYDDKGMFDGGAARSAFGDALLLGADVILFDSADLTDDLLELIEGAETRNAAVVCAAGNNGRTGTQSVYQSCFGIKNPAATVQDYGTVSDAASAETVFTAGSRESGFYSTPCITYGKNRKTTFSDTNANYDVAGSHTFTTHFDGKTLEYVPVGGTGTIQDCQAAGDLNGKIALIRRGSLTFTEKVNNAAGCGAAGVIIYDNIENNADNVLMSLEGALIPAIFISYESGMVMLAETEREVRIKDGETLRAETENGGSVSSFSSRGVTPSLEIKPDLVDTGGSRDIILFEDGTKKAVGSNTLFSAAAAAAKIAVLAGYYKNRDIPYDIASLKLVLMNAASPVKDMKGTEYSPRAQGAGAVDLTDVLRADSLIRGPDGKGKISLGDCLNDSFTVRFFAKNITDKTVTYKLSATVAGDDYIYYSIAENGLAVRAIDKAAAHKGFPAFITENARAFSSASVVLGDIQKTKGNLNSYSESHEPAFITLKAGEEREIVLLCTLDGKTASEYASVFPNGYFIDGYITLTSGDGNTSSVPYTGYRGNFGKLKAADPSVYDPDTYYGASCFYSVLSQLPPLPDADMYSEEVILGYNRYAQEILFKKELVAFSPNSDGLADSLSFAFCLLRDVSGVTFTVSDKDGNTVVRRAAGELKKSYAKNPNTGQYRTAIWDGKAEDNAYYTYPDGKYTMTVTATPIFGAAQKYSLPFVIDTAAPQTGSIAVTEKENGERILTAKINDNHYIGRARLYTSDKNKEFESVLIFDDLVSDHTCAFDITGIDTDYVYLEISDYAFNTSTNRIDLNDQNRK